MNVSLCLLSYYNHNLAALAMLCLQYHTISLSLTMIIQYYSVQHWLLILLFGIATDRSKNTYNPSLILLIIRINQYITVKTVPLGGISVLAMTLFGFRNFYYFLRKIFTNLKEIFSTIWFYAVEIGIMRGMKY